MKNIAIQMFAASLALGSVALAQKDPATDKKPMPASGDPVVRLHKLGDIDGLELKNGDKSVGEIKGLVIDSTDGRILFAKVGGDEHLIPWESIQFAVKDMEKNEGVKATTRLTEEQIKAAPVCKKDVPIDGQTIRMVRENAKLASDSSWERAAQNGLIMSNELMGARVSSTDDKDVGEIDEVVIAPNEGVVAYTVLGAGGVLGIGEKKLALPWGVMNTTIKDKKLHIALPVTKERLEKAPEYKGEWKHLSGAPFVREISTYWSKDPFWVRASPASAPKRQ
jgi:sporulation protein YlmC with PRC-barrel domain